MEAIMRAYRDEDDYWRIRDFLREVFRLNGQRELSWQVYRRLKRMGATMAYVGSYSPPAHALYSSVGFTELSYPWVKEL